MSAEQPEEWTHARKQAAKCDAVRGRADDGDSLGCLALGDDEPRVRTVAPCEVAGGARLDCASAAGAPGGYPWQVHDVALLHRVDGLAWDRPPHDA